VRIFFNPKIPNEKLQPILDEPVDQFMKKEEGEREDFRSLLQKFVRFYGYVSQLITFEDPDLEKLYVFARHLNRKLPKRKATLPTDVLDAVDLDSFRIQQTFKGRIKLEGEDGGVTGISEGTPHFAGDEKELLSHIVTTLNETYGLNLTDEDKVDVEGMTTKLKENEELKAVMISNNTLDNKKYKFDKVVDDLLLDFVHTKIGLYKKLTDPRVNTLFKRKWFDGYHRKFTGKV